MRLTGHKSEASLLSYDNKNPAARKREISEVLNFVPSTSDQQSHSDTNVNKKVKPTHLVTSSTRNKDTIDFDSNEDHSLIEALSQTEDSHLNEKSRPGLIASTQSTKSLTSVRARAFIIFRQGSIWIYSYYLF